MPQTISDRIRTQMAALNLTQASLAEQTAIPTTTLQRRLARPGDFTMDELNRIADALGFNPLSGNDVA